VEDDSVSGSDPDGPTDDDDPFDSSDTDTELSEDADMGLAKRVVDTELKADGCTEIVYEFNIENLGNVTISNIQVTDDLNTAGFGDDKSD
jgi:hypothetical protein